MTVELAAGEEHALVLEISDRELNDDPPAADRAWAATEEAWSQVAPDCGGLIAVSDARHAYAVLRGLTSAEGGMVAAATTSLPERLEGGRNYDYRYAWIRDQCYAGLAVAAHGPHPLLAGAVRFVTERVLADGAKLMPAYTVAGEPIGDEKSLRLRGFPGATSVPGGSGGSGRPARAGNWVRGQFQLDALGEVLSLLAAAAGHDMLAEDEWRAAAVAADAIEKRWQEPDAGIWELDDKHWTHSRLACVSGLRAIADRGRDRARRAATGTARRRDGAAWPTPSRPAWATPCTLPAGGSGHRTTSGWTRRCCCPRSGAGSRSRIRGGWRPSRRCGSELASDGYVYRFRHDARPLHKAEGAFLLCGFWMALVDHALGDPVAAAHWFERSRGACGPPRCTPRSTTCTRSSCGGTCRRRSCTPACSSAR